MPKALAIRDADEWDEYLEGLERGNTPPRNAPRHPQPGHSSDRIPISESRDPNAGGFNPTFTGSRHERDWILTYLGPFYHDHLITDVLRVVKGGKEATVYVCKAHPSTSFELLAAKVYRPKQYRSFKNDADYKWGRPILSGDGEAIRDKRLLKAVAQGSKTGEAVSHASWLTHEFTTMKLLHDHGAHVPKPIVQDENAMLMEYFGDEYSPAPTLIETRLPREGARDLFNDLMRNVELMLSHDRIHGDLSAYNVLYWEGRGTLIDFPQVIDAYGNPNAFRFLLRDVERLCQYFQRLGVNSDPLGIARGMWDRTMPDETFQIRGARSGW